MPLILFFISLFVFSSSSHAGFTGMSYAEEQSLTDVHSQRKSANFIRNSGLNKLDMGFKQTAPINSKLPAVLTRPVNYSVASLRNLAKLKALTPSGIALTAALTAAGYIIDEYGDVVESGKVDPEYQDGFFWASGSAWSYASTPSATATLHRSVGWGKSYPFDISCSSSSSCTATFDRSSDSLPDVDVPIYRVACSGSSSSHCPSSPPISEPQPVSDEDFIKDVAPDLEWDNIPFDDAGAPFQTPEYTETINNLNNWYETNYNDNSQTSTSTSTSTTIINNDGSETTTETAEQDIPAFCNWAGIVCDAINWIREPFSSPSDIALPSEEIVIPSYTSGLSDNGTCPVPYQAIVFGSTIPVSYQPFCDLASMIRPLVLAAAGLIAGFVLVRARG